MKIIQVNGWLGRINGPLERFLKNESPDIVCMQEGLMPVDEDLPPLRDQYHFIKEIQKTAGLDNISFGPTWGYKIAGALINVGNPILSKYPLSNVKQTYINNSYYVANLVSDYQRNTRAIQSAEIDINGVKLTIANHQAYLSGEHARGDEESLEKMRKVAGILSGLPRPLIFCGDLNVAPDTPTINALDSLGLRNLIIETGVKTTLSEAHRAPAEDRNSVVCDYIFVSEEIRPIKLSVANEVVSDHKALILEFEI